MKPLYLATVAVALGLAACGDYSENEAAYDNDAAAYPEGTAEGADYAGTGATTTTTWPEGARIVVEEGVTYRVMPGGERVVLGPDESRIIIEDGVRFRVDPGGERVRIDEQGAVISVDTDGVSATVNTGE